MWGGRSNVYTVTTSTPSSFSLIPRPRNLGMGPRNMYSTNHANGVAKEGNVAQDMQADGRAVCEGKVTHNTPRWF